MSAKIRISTKKKFSCSISISIAFLIFILAALSIGIGHELLFNRADDTHQPIASAIENTNGGHTPEQPGFNQFKQLVFYPNKIQRTPPKITESTIVAFVFGQSNSANHGGEFFASNAKGKLYNYWDGKFYLASDPLLGATGVGGSVWTRVGAKLLESNLADTVVLLAAGVGGTSVKAWQEGGRLNEMLKKRLVEAHSSNIKVTHFLWHQGETDNALDPTEYADGLKQVILLTQAFFPNSKFFVAQASLCGTMPSSPRILEAQRNITKQRNVFLGPNTDKISLVDRYDDCHLSGPGLEKHASDWIIAIKHPEKSK